MMCAYDRVYYKPEDALASLHTTQFIHHYSKLSPSIEHINYLLGPSSVYIPLSYILSYLFISDNLLSLFNSIKNFINQLFLKPFLSKI